MIRSRVLLALLAGAAIAASPSPGTMEHEHEPVPASPEPLSQATGAGPLQAMIDSAYPGDMLHIPAGTYDGPIVIDKELMLHPMGEVIIDGGGQGSVVTVTAPGTFVHGITVQHSGRGPVGQPAGISIEASDVTVEDSLVRTSYIGIAVRGTSGAVIDGNSVIGDAHAAIADEGHAMGGSTMGGRQATTRGDGISLWNATDARVTDNVVDGVRDGVYLSYGDGITVEGNTVRNSRYAMHDMFALHLTIRDNVFRDSLSGLILMYGGPVTLDHNAMVANRSASTGFGLLIKDADQVTSTDNTISDNRVGIHVENGGAPSPDVAHIQGNTIALNEVGIELDPSSRAAFSGNAIAENTVPVLFIGEAQVIGVTWTIDGIGNYWNMYQGYDADGDGIGDIAFEHPGTVEKLVRNHDQLAALAGGPGFTLLGRLESRWNPTRPAIVDDAPMMRPDPPAVRLSTPGDRQTGFGIAAAVVLIACIAVIIRARRPRIPRVEVST